MFVYRASTSAVKNVRFLRSSDASRPILCRKSCVILRCEGTTLSVKSFPVITVSLNAILRKDLENSPIFHVFLAKISGIFPNLFLIPNSSDTL